MCPLQLLWLDGHVPQSLAPGDSFVHDRYYVLMNFVPPAVAQTVN